MRRSIIFFSALLALSSASAFAEEMATPPSSFITARMPYLTWTGLYAGINGGYAWSNPNVSYVANDAASRAATCSIPGGAKCIPIADFIRDGGLFGGQAGFNWQFNSYWLAGVEADYQWADFTGTGNSPFRFGGTGAPPPGVSTMSAKETVGSFATLRARLGALPIPSLLLYGTGGLAVAEVKGSFTLMPGGTGSGTSGGFSYSCTAGVVCFSGSSSHMLVGWTAGGGAEYAITSTLTFKTEVLYAHLEKPSTTVTATALGTPGTSPSSFTGTFGYTYFIVARGGLNFRL